jgi:dihydroorotate dehydrogenase (fumarate)
MDLTTQYLGLTLANPFMPGASPMGADPDAARRLEDAGAAAIVMNSLFEEQIEAEQLGTIASVERHAESFPESTSFFPELPQRSLGPQEYLSRIAALREAVSIPVIGSLNGVTAGGWLRYAELIEQAGAHALEMNVYFFPAAADRTGREIEAEAAAIVRAVKAKLSIPVAVKLSPYFTALPNFARSLEDAGADGLVLFNRFFQPDIDPENLTLERRLELSDSRELLPRLGWIALLSGVSSVSFAASGGVHTTRDAVRAIVAGADVVQVVSALLQRGPEYIGALRRSFVEWMEEHEYDSLEQLRGSMNGRRCPDPQMLGRVNYMRLLQSWRP